VINVKSNTNLASGFSKKAAAMFNWKNRSVDIDRQRSMKIGEIASLIDSTAEEEEVLRLILNICCDIKGVGLALLTKIGAGDTPTQLIHPKISNLKITAALSQILRLAPQMKVTDLTSQFMTTNAKIDIAATNEILIFKHLNQFYKGDHPQISYEAIQKLFGCKNVAILPLMLDGKHWGDLVLLLTQSIPLETLENLRSQISIAKYSHDRLANLSKRNQELKSINSIATEVSQCQDIYQIINKTLGEIKRIFNANAVGVYMKDAQSGEIKLAGQCGMPEEVLKQSQSFAPDAPYCQILKSEQTVLLGPMQQFPVRYQNVNKHRFTPLPIWFMSAPIFIDGQREGILTLIRYHEQNFNTDEQDLIISLCNQISIAFENTFLHQKLLGRINELENTRNKLIESEQKMQLTVESVSEAIMVASLDGRILRANKAASSMHGYERNEEFIGKSSLMYVTFEDRRRMLENLKKIKETGVFRNAEYTLVKKDGSKFQTECSISIFRNFLGIPEGFVICIRDISARKMAEKRLLDNERKYRLITDNTSDYISLMSSGGVYTYVSPSFRLLGYEPTELINKPGLDIIHPDDKKIILPALIKFAQMDKTDLARIKKGNFSHHLEYRVKDKQGKWHDFESSGNIVESYNDDGYNLLLTARDVTEKKKNDNQLKALYDSEKAARQALEQEINRRADFFRALVHELKTPLTPILVSSETLRDLAPDKTFANLASNVYHSAIRMNNRVDELLDISKGELGLLKLNLDPVDISHLLKTFIMQLQPQLEQNMQTLVADIPDSLPQILGEDIRIHQIIVNLFDNAIKFTPDNGQIFLDVIADENDILIKIRDTGKGIDDAEKERIFQPYNRIESDRQHYSGLGLGLALCKQLVDLHHGKLWIESQKGQGSTFYLSFPALKIPAESQAKPQAQNKLG
jgi:PAS domain S-box-containing protein